MLVSADFLRLIGHYRDIMSVIMSAMVSQITGAWIVCSTVCSGADQRKNQSSASRAFARGIHQWQADFPHKRPVTPKMFPFDDVIMGTVKYSHDTIIHLNSKDTRSYCGTWHNDVIKWKHFPGYWPFVWGIHRSPVNSPHKGQWRGALIFSLRLNKRLSKQSWGWWFETPSWSLWRHCNRATVSRVQSYCVVLYALSRNIFCGIITEILLYLGTGNSSQVRVQLRSIAHNFCHS